MIRHVYIAGPYTQGDPVKNTRKALGVADYLQSLGFVPFVPHLSHFWHFLTPKPYETWMEWDLAWLAKCDALVRLPGLSPGADREVDRARELGIPVFLDYNALPRPRAMEKTS